MKTPSLARRIRLLLLALIGMALLLAALLWYGVSSEALRVLHPAMQELPDEAATTSGHLADISAALERPLLWQSRTPVAADAAPAVQAKTSGKVDGFKLLGIILDQGKSTALLRTSEGVKRVSLDDKVQGWAVAEVTSTTVTLTSASQRVELSVLPARNPLIRLEATDAE